MTSREGALLSPVEVSEGKQVMGGNSYGTMALSDLYLGCLRDRGCTVETLGFTVKSKLFQGREICKFHSSSFPRRLVTAG
jgi:hypothetical protein